MRNKMKMVWKKSLPVLLCIAMLFSLFQLSVFTTKTIKADSGGIIVEDAYDGVLNKDLTFQGNWYCWQEAGRHGGSKGETTQKDASVSYTFTGIGIDVYSHINPNFGSVQIFIDDKDMGVFSLKNGSVNETRLLVSFNDLLPGSHTIKIISTGGTTNVDYFEVHSDVSVVDDSIKNALNPNITYKGNWYVWAETGRYGGTKAETTDPKATLSFTFTGVGIDIYAHLNPTFGSFRILLDGLDKGIFSLKENAGSGTETKQLATFHNLFMGSHTIEFIDVSGKVNLDYFNVYSSASMDTLALQIDGKSIAANNGMVHLQEGEHSLAASYMPQDPHQDDVLTIICKEDGKEERIIATQTLQDQASFLINETFFVDRIHNGLTIEFYYNDRNIGTVYERIYSMPKATSENRFQEGDIVGFLGDSITHDNYAGVSYSSFIYDYYVTRFPHQRIDLINLGICSYDAQAVLDTFDTDIKNQGLTKATLMLGMNDVQRHLYDQNTYASSESKRAEIRKTYQSNISSIVDKLQTSGIDSNAITLLTPSIYDQTKTSNMNSDGSFKTRVNDGLAEFSQDLFHIQADKATNIIDFQNPMLQINKTYQIDNPNGTFTQNDLIHPNPMGHSMMGYLFLQQQGVTETVASVSIQQDQVQSENAQVNNLKVAKDFIRFTYQPNSLPMAATSAYKEADTYVGISDDLNREIIQVAQLDPDATYTLMMDQTSLGTFKGHALEKGINIATLEKNPNQIAAMQVEQINQKRKDLESNVRDITWFEYLQRTGIQNRAYIPDLANYDASTFTYTLKSDAKAILDTKYAENKAAQTYYDVKSNPEKYATQLDVLRTQMYEAAQSAIAKTHVVTIAKENVNMELKLPNFFAENMVLQRDKPHTIWGKGIPEQEYTISLANDEYQSNAQVISDEHGDWTVDLDALPAQSTPYALTISDGYDEVKIEPVFVGDVFVCAGQSNMELRYDQIVNMNLDHNPSGPYDRSETPTLLEDPNIKFFTASWNSSSTETFDVPMQYGSWKALSKQNNSQLSYLAMYFAKDMLEKNPGIPIGLMSVAWGGTPITRWMKSGDAQIYNNHIAPLTDYKIAGVLWYQGEDDAKDTYANDMNSHLTYRTRMAQLINEYREAWNEADLPFIYAQLARYSGGSNNGVKDFQAVRQAQLEALDMVANSSNVEMITTIDTDMGTAANIHPLGKDIIAKRIANAFEKMQKNTDSVTTGPLFKQAEVSKENPKEMIVSFKTGTADNLQRMQPIYDKTATPDHFANKVEGQEVSAFELAGADKKYYPAKAVIQGNQVVVSSEHVSSPVYVRYAYDYASKNPDLYNAAGLPASPFTSERTYKVVTIGDSITEGHGVVNNSVNRYSTLLNNKLNEPIGLGDFYVVNRGRSGTTLNQEGDSPYWTNGPWKDALKDRGDIYTIALGTNDSKPQNFQHIANFKAHYNEMIHTIRQFNPNARIYVCKPVPALLYGEYANGSGINNPNVLEIGKLIEEIAEENKLTVIDFYTAFENAMQQEPTPDAQRIYGSSVNADYPKPGNDTMTKYLYDKNAKSASEGNLSIDRIHPGAYGHEFLANTMYDALYTDLTMIQVDYSALQEAIKKAESILAFEQAYTTESWSTFITALEAAKRICNDAFAKQSMIDEATIALLQAFDQLEEHTNYMKEILWNVIQKTELYIADGKLDTLAPAVQSNIQLRFAQAKSVYANTSSSNAQYMEAWLNLADALHYMSFEANKQDLKNLIDICDKVETDKFTQGVEIFLDALAYAHQVYDDEGVLQETINQAYQQLTNAKDNLFMGNVDKTLLRTLIDKVTSATQDGSLYFENDAWINFNEILNEANRIYNDVDASQKDVNDSFKALASAFEDLRLKPNEALLKALTEFVSLIDSIDLQEYNTEDITTFIHAKARAMYFLQNPTSITKESQIQMQNEMEDVKQRIRNHTLAQVDDNVQPEDNTTVENVQTVDKNIENTTMQSTSSIAKTGDKTNTFATSILCFTSLGILIFLKRKQN